MKKTETIVEVKTTTTVTTSKVIIPHGIQERLKKKAKIDKAKESVKPTVINDDLIR